MAVQSIRTPVQVRHVTGDQLFVTASKMTFGEMDGVRKFDDLTKKSGRAPKHLIMPGTCVRPDPFRQKSYASAVAPVASASSVILILVSDMRIRIEL